MCAKHLPAGAGAPSRQPYIVGPPYYTLQVTQSDMKREGSVNSWKEVSALRFSTCGVRIGMAKTLPIKQGGLNYIHPSSCVSTQDELNFTMRGGA